MAIAVLWGAVRAYQQCTPDITLQKLIPHHQYNTAAFMLINSFNHHVMIASLTIYALWLAVYITRKLGRTAGRIAFGIPLCIVAVSMAKHFDLVRRIKNTTIAVDSAVIKEAVSSGMLQIIAAAACFCFGIYIIKRMRSKQQTERKQHIGLLEKLPNCIANICRGIQMQTAPISILLALFMAVNALNIYIKVSNAMTLRNNPNIIFIMVDTLRADHLSCYGYSRNTTPNIDQLARQGIRFSKTISQAPWTTPSVSSFMTGRYQRIGLNNGVPENSVDIPFLWEMLKDHGYATAGVVSNPLAGGKHGFNRGWDYFDENYAEDDISSPGVVNSAQSAIKQFKDRKFFLFMLFLDPHCPYVQHDKYNYDPGYKGKLAKSVTPNDIDTRYANLTPDDIKYTKSLYDSEISFTDEYIGNFLRSLKKMNLYNDTLIVFLADHGEGFNEHGQMSHGKSLYDELLSVPLIIKLPGQKSGRVVAGTNSLIDLFPSMMAYLNYSISDLNLQGSALDLKRIRSIEPKAIYSSTIFGQVELKGLRSATQKYIIDTKTHKEELYDLAKDPKEKHNLITKDQKTVLALRKMIQSKDQQIDTGLQIASNFDQKPADLDDTEKQRLRSLGYLAQ